MTAPPNTRISINFDFDAIVLKVAIRRVLTGES